MELLTFQKDSPAKNNMEPLTFEKGTQIECNQISIKFESLQKELMERNLELYQLRDKITKLESRKFSYKNISKSNAKVQFYTGIRAENFIWLFERIKNHVKSYSKKISLENHLLLVLLRLRRGLFIKYLAFRFSLNYILGSKIFRCWIVVIASRLKFLINWPD
ncbi:uncharacterized protein LOC136087253 [Hydra vulgaris]|uniref:Uncharacterized protein LOC136087253 n=1 Tax=Hydra vulgaris TaxID=6087 RepID=A0ABM4CV19_HYDVU